MNNNKVRYSERTWTFPVWKTDNIHSQLICCKYPRMSIYVIKKNIQEIQGSGAVPSKVEMAVKCTSQREKYNYVCKHPSQNI